MNIVLGASGQVGSAIVERLRAQQAPVTAVVHSAEKAEPWKAKGVPFLVADSFDATALDAAFRQAPPGSAVFLLTPETGKSDDVLGDTRELLANYRTALQNSPIEKIVGLSSMGAQHEVGNLAMSYLLERAFNGLNQQTIFVRPAYYYSNWLLFSKQAKEQGILPTYYPLDLAMPMIAPQDVASFVADRMTESIDGSPIYEVEGPSWYSSHDVASALGQALGRDVQAQQIPRAQWDDSLRKAGFTEDAVKNFVAMTELVASGQAHPERSGTVAAQTAMTLPEYLKQFGNLG